VLLKESLKKLNSMAKIKVKNQKIPKKLEFAEAKTEAKFLPISDRKMRMVIDQVKDLSPAKALVSLQFLNKKAAGFLIKAIKTAMADAQNNFHLNKDSLVFKEIKANRGPVLKRRDVYHGARFNGGVIKKPRTHLIVRLVGEKL